MCKSYFNEVDFKRGKAFSQLTLMFHFFFSNQYYHQSIHRNTGGLTEKF